MRHRSIQLLWLSVAALLVAAGLRLWHISQTPPGLHYDEAFHLLRAEDIVTGRAFAVYFTGNQGNEPMQAYLSALVMLTLGPVSWVGRLVEAWAGILSVALTIRAGQEMFSRRSVGVLGGWALAMLCWHLTLSRFGTQPVLASVAAAAVMAALWRSARTGQRRAFVLAGVSLAFGLWSYVAFRIFPAVPLLAGIGLLITRPEQRRALWLGGAVMAGTTLVLYAPLVIFALQNPQSFFYRYSQTTLATFGAANPVLNVLQNIPAVITGLFVPGQGDANWRFNFPGRPALDVVQAAFFCLGVILCLWHWRKLESLVVLSWAGVGLAASILTEYPPQFGRMVMGAPAVALIIAVGLEALWRWRGGRKLFQGVVVAALLFSFGLTAYEYFWHWGQNSSLFIAYDTGYAWMMRQLRAAPAGSALYETPIHRDYATFEYLLQPEAYARFKTFKGPACTVLPANPTITTTYAIIVNEDANTLPLLQTAFPAGRVTAQEFLDQRLYAVIYQIPAGQPAQLAPETPRPVDYGGMVRWLGYQLPARAVSAGQALRLTVYWQVTQATRAAYKTFVHLIGPPQADGNVVYAQYDSEPCDNAYPSWQWAAGDVVVEYYTVAVPAGTPAGEYALQIGWYDSGTLERLAAADEQGQALGDSVELERVRITAP